MSSWTSKEKLMFLKALKQHGNNVGDIQKMLPDRTVTEIRSMFEKYTQLAQSKMNEEEKLRHQDSAINQWIRVLKKDQPKNSLIDIVPKALKYIALFEQRPIDKDVNLKECYLTLADLCKGVVSKTLHPTTEHFLFEGNLARLAVSMYKADLSKHKEFINSVKTEEIYKTALSARRTYTRNKRKKVDLTVNPLNVPVDLLKNDISQSDNVNV